MKFTYLCTQDFDLQKYEIIGELKHINITSYTQTEMKTLRICILNALILFPSLCMTLSAQNNAEGENYYSNPKKGIKASVPKPYYDTTVVNKTDDLTVELVGELPDTTPKSDSTKNAIRALNYSLNNTQPSHLRGYNYFDEYYTDLYWYTGNPYYWGTSIYYCWDPWYSPYWNGWYYPGWGGSYWHITHPWGYGPYWSFGWGWHSPWYYSPYYYYPGYYAYYGWGGYYGWGAYGWGGYHSYGWGHQYLGSTRQASTLTSSRNSGTTPSPSGRGTVRRGGVDLNNGGRGGYGNVSGTGTRTASNNNGRTAVNSNNTGRYSKPASVATNRAAQSQSRNNPSRNNYSQPSNSRSFNGTRNSNRSYDNGTRSSNSRFDNGSRSSNRSYDNSNRSSNRSSYSSGSRSSSSSSSRGSYSGGSSSRGSSGGGGGSRGGGGSHSSGGRR